MKIDVGTSQFIARIYDGVVAPDAWSDILDELIYYVGARGATLAVIDTLHSHMNLSASSGLFSQADLTYYNENLAQYETVAWEILLANKAGKAFSDVELESGIEEHLHETPLADWLRNTIGCQYRAAIRLSDGKPWHDVMALQFAQGRGQINPEERAALEIFSPHLSKAIELNRPFAMLKARYNAVMAFLDKLDLGVAIVTPRSEIILSNEEAKRIFTQRDGLFLQENATVQLGDPDENSRFLDAVLTISETSNKAKGTLSSLFNINRLSGKSPFMIEICPIGTGSNALEDASRGAVVVILDPSNRKSFSPKGLDQLFALTGAEFQIAKLILEGHETKVIAEKRNVSPETVRSQAKSILHKTGCQNRNDLLRLAVAANPPVKD